MLCWARGEGLEPPVYVRQMELLYAVEIQNYCALTCLVPKTGLEPVRPKALAPKASAAAITPLGQFHLPFIV